MMEILEFVFSSIWRFLGFCFILGIIGNGIVYSLHEIFGNHKD